LRHETYENGQGMSRDPLTVAAWFERAAKQEDAHSKQALRRLAAEGIPKAVAAVRRLRLAP